MSTLRANTLKPITSGNSLVLQGDSGGSGVSGPSIDSNGDVDFSQNTNAKVKLPSGGGIYESDGSTEILTESSGVVTLKNAVIDQSISIGSSGKIIRNIAQVALASNQTLSNSSTMTTFFSPTYTPIASGTVQGCLTFLLEARTQGFSDGRKIFRMEFTGSDITNITYNDSNEFAFGLYDYGGSGVQVHYASTIMGPLITTSGNSQITCDCRMQNQTANTGTSWSVYGNNTLEETFMTWIEYK